jgi:hypothetical protein
MFTMLAAIARGEDGHLAALLSVAAALVLQCAAFALCARRLRSLLCAGTRGTGQQRRPSRAKALEEQQRQPAGGAGCAPAPAERSDRAPGQLQPATQLPLRVSLQGLLAEAAAKAGQVAAAGGGAQQQRAAAASYPRHTRTFVASIKVGSAWRPAASLHILARPLLACWLM